MKLVIDIPADDFNSIRNGALFYIQHDRLDEVVTHAFNKAIILPDPTDVKNEYNCTDWIP